MLIIVVSVSLIVLALLALLNTMGVLEGFLSWTSFGRIVTCSLSAVSKIIDTVYSMYLYIQNANITFIALLEDFLK